MPEITITSDELHENTNQYIEEALKAPISVTTISNKEIVMLDAKEYRQMKARSRKSVLANELSVEDLTDIVTGEMDERHNHLNKLLEEP